MLLAALLLAQDAVTPSALMAAYREKTRAETPCRAAASEDEIVVCANRQADQYRLPLVSSYSGRDTPDGREERLLDTAPPRCGQEAFVHDCGFVGVTVKVNRSGGARIVRRPLAP